jgi:hypothetical protein
VSDSEEDDMDDDDYRKICHLSNFSLPLQFQELPGPKHTSMPPPDSPPVAYFQLFFPYLILTLMVTEANRYVQQVITNKAAHVSTLLKNWTRFTMDEMKGFLMGIIKKPTIAPYWA